MKCKKPLHEWQIVTIGNPEVKQGDGPVPGSRLLRHELAFARQCRLCGFQETRTVNSSAWDSKDRSAEEQASRFFNAKVDLLKQTAKGWAPTEPELEKLRSTIFEQYHRIWADWFRPMNVGVNALFVVALAEASSGYHKDADLIEIAVQDGTTLERNVHDLSKWPSWMGELVHEILHEFECKVPFEASNAGREFFRCSTKKFKDHPTDDSRFFTAMIGKAPYFGLKPEELLKNL